MKCPKCSYVSHDYLDACRKCGVQLVSFKQDMGLLVLQPGVLDLGLVLGEARPDDLFASMGEDITMHAGNDDDFEISLGDDADHPAVRHPAVGAPRAGARGTAEEMTGLDHLTLELDVSALPAALAASLSVALALPDAPSTSPTPAVPAPALPEESMLPEHITLDTEPDSGSITLPSGALAALTATPVERSETTENVEGEQSEGDDDVASLDDVELSVDDALFASQANEPSGSDLTEVVEPARNSVDAPGLEEVSLLPVLEFEPDTSALETDMMRSSLAMTTLDDAALTFMDENMPPTQPSRELTATTGEATPEDALISSDMFALEDLQEPTLPGDLSIELSDLDTGPEQGSTTSDALALGDLDDTTLPGHLTLDLDISGLMANWSSATPDDVRLDDPPGDVQDVQSELSPPQNQAGDNEELLLDLDTLNLDTLNLDTVEGDEDAPA